MTKKISELSAAASLGGSELVPVVQSGATVRTTVALLNAMPRAISTITSLQATLDGKAALSGNQTITGTTSLRQPSGGAPQTRLLDSTGTDVAQIRALAGANLGIGADAVGAITTGTYNVGVGSSACMLVTSGYLNTGIGLNALGAMTQGFQNTAIGANALQHADGVPGALPGTNGTNNTMVGANAGQQITTGHRNTGIGVDALFVETTGDYNVGIGVHALNSQVGADGNTAVGYYSLFTNVTGAGNVAVGRQALGDTTVSNGTAVGEYAGGAVTTSTYTTAIGAQALFSPAATFANRTTSGGDYQTAVGALTGQYSVTAVLYGTALGYSALFGSTGAVALGAHAEARHDRSVAIGMQSITTAAYQVMVGPRDVEITDTAKGLVIKSPDGTRYRVKVANGGALSTVAA